MMWEAAQVFPLVSDYLFLVAFTVGKGNSLLCTSVPKAPVSRCTICWKALLRNILLSVKPYCKILSKPDFRIRAASEASCKLDFFLDFMNKCCFVSSIFLPVVLSLVYVRGEDWLLDVSPCSSCCMCRLYVYTMLYLLYSGIEMLPFQMALFFFSFFFLPCK